MGSSASVADSDDSLVSYKTAASGPTAQNPSPQHRRNLSGESLGSFSELDTPPRDFMSRWVTAASHSAVIEAAYSREKSTFNVAEQGYESPLCHSSPALDTVKECRLA